MGKLISICIPVRNKLEQLKDSLPLIVSQAFFSPPVEIVIVNYSSTDGLELYIEEVCQTKLPNGSYFTVEQVNNKEEFSLVDATKIGVQSSSGEYVLVLNENSLPTKHSLQHIRDIINVENPDWLENKNNVICKRELLLSLKDEELSNLSDALHNHGGKSIQFPTWFICEL